MGMEFQSGKMKRFCGGKVVIVAQQCEGTQCHRTVHLKTW